MKPDEEQLEREQFLRRRKKGIGGSDVGAVLGVDRYADAIDVYLDKTQDQEDIDNPAMERGRMLEGVVSQKYMMETGRRLKPGKFRRHRKHPFLIGNPDRIILANGKPPHENMTDGTGVLECKTANQYVFKQMKAEGLPQSYLLQLQHYMGICGVEWGAFGVLCPDPWEFLSFDLAFDEHLFEEVAYVLERFWKDNVERGIPPIPEKVDWSDAPEVPADEELTAMDNPNWTAAIELLRDSKNLIAIGKSNEEHAKSLLKTEMGGTGIFEGAGARVYYRDQSGRKTFQKRELSAMQPLDPISMAVLLEKAGLSLDVIEVFFDEARLDLDRFEKQGPSFTTLRMYDSKE